MERRTSTDSNHDPSSRANDDDLEAHEPLSDYASSSDYAPSPKRSHRRPSLLALLLPEPTQRLATPRVFLTGAIAVALAVYIFVTFFQARTRMESELGRGWVYMDSVSWGQGNAAGNPGGKEVVNEVEVGGSTASGSTTGTQGTSTSSSNLGGGGEGIKFSRVKAEMVASLEADGLLSQYLWHETLRLPEVTVAEAKTPGRVIIVGDIHGMHVHLLALLTRLSFSPTTDTLLTTGDVVSKSPLNGSLETVRLLQGWGAKGVRGNHDEGVLEWRKWMESYGPLMEGEAMGSEVGVWAGGSLADQELGEVNKRAWWNFGGGKEEVDEPEVDGVDAETTEDGSDGAGYDFPSPTTATPADDSTPSSSVRPLSHTPTSTPSHGMSDAAHGVSHSSLLSSGALLSPGYDWLSLKSSQLADVGVVVPEGWEWGGEWFEIARHLGSEQVGWMRERSLTVWLEDWKTYLVHAGLVPSNTSIPSSSSSSSSPLPSLLLSTSSTSFTPPQSLSRILASSPSHSLLLQPQNTDPFTLLNMRTLSADDEGNWVPSSHGKPGKGEKRTRKWFDVWAEEQRSGEEIGVVYGHWAGEGLTVKKNSIGLDSGCVYGRQLSALILYPSESNPANPLSIPSSPSTSDLLSNYRILPTSEIPPLLHPSASKTTNPNPLFGLGGGSRPKLPPAGANPLGISATNSQAMGGASTNEKRETKRDEKEEEQAEEGASEIQGGKTQDEDGQGETVEEVLGQEEGFEARRVMLGGKRGWVVSVECKVA